MKRGINFEVEFKLDDVAYFVTYSLHINEKHKIQIKRLTKCCVSKFFLFMIAGDPIACSSPRIS